MMSHRLLTLWDIASVFGCPEELDSKTRLLKTTHGLVLEHEEIKVMLNLDMPSLMARFHGAIRLYGSYWRRKLIFYPVVNPVSYDNNQPGQTYPLIQ